MKKLFFLLSLLSITAITIATSPTSTHAAAFESPKIVKNSFAPVSGGPTASKYLTVATNHRYWGLMMPGNAIACSQWSEKIKTGYVSGNTVNAHINYEMFGTCANGTAPGTPCTIDANCSGGGTCTLLGSGTANVEFYVQASCTASAIVAVFPAISKVAVAPIGTLGTNSQSGTVAATVDAACAVGKRILWRVCRAGDTDANNDSLLLTSWNPVQ